MQEYWEIYMKNIEGKPASIQFNAGISMEIEDQKFIHPHVGFVKVMLKNPNENGLLKEEEETEILYIEDKLEASLIKFRIGKYVGRIISDGSVTFIYYLQFTYNWKDFLEYALDEVGSYEITSGFQEDFEWNYYQNLLYPTASEWQIIQNHKVCKSLSEQGDNLQLERAIEHKVYFLEGGDRDGFLASIKEDGFIFQEDIENEEGVKGVKFYRKDRVFYYDIDEITLMLIKKAESFSALYDGWETSLVKS